MWKQVAIFPLLLIVTYNVTQWILWDDKLYTLKDKRVLVTGASEGIGEQIAYQYARLGANVVVTARRLDKLNKVVENCQSLSPSPHSKHFAVSADMWKLDDTKRVIQEAVRLMGGLDVLVLNHVTAYYDLHPYNATPEDLDELHKVMDINFRSYVHLASHAMPQMLANEGSIVVVNSMAGNMPQLYLFNYSAAKHALNGFFMALRQQFIAFGQNVSVTNCNLGLIGTDNAKKLVDDDPNPTDSVMKWLNPASPAQTALDIVLGGARRDREVYIPYWKIRPLLLAYAIWPSLAESWCRQSMLAMRNHVERTGATTRGKKDKKEV